MSKVRGVLNYAGCFSEAAGSVDSVTGRLVYVMDWATFTTLCSFVRSWSEQELYQIVIPPERMLSMVHLLKLLRVVTDMPNFLSLLRK